MLCRLRERTAAVAAGELAVNQVLPAEVRLAREYGVSLGTARHASKLLHDFGLVVTLRGKGTFVVRVASEDDARRISEGEESRETWEFER
ncbi:MAG TPA: GntR family transcriptional regulator [Amycolatopsis sp.]|uniref:GntR family transcriptional regulator n=1 Tax=Amycolatopsis sp. TaxID=37632 RepID=UPI002B473B0E|nr:GntR family transcriptional regulator [Amycolatopsis sp.]HKS47741.1 GntR family transcriptional regulator [Amycolatopsis sp.]